MKKKIISLILIGIIIILFLLSIVLNKGNIEKVCIHEKCINVEISSTPEELQRGLMFRENLAENSGMLFIFPKEGINSFWMKNTLFNIDIIWLDSDKKIVYLKEDAKPCTTNPCGIFMPESNSKYVLEVNSGFIKSNNVSLGDNFKFIS